MRRGDTSFSRFGGNKAKYTCAGEKAGWVATLSGEAIVSVCVCMCVCV